MINGGFEGTLERNGHARGDVKSKCFSHVHFGAEVLGGRSTAEAIAIYQATPGGLGRGSLLLIGSGRLPLGQKATNVWGQGIKHRYACNWDKNQTSPGLT